MARWKLPCVCVCACVLVVKVVAVVVCRVNDHQGKTEPELNQTETNWTKQWPKPKLRSRSRRRAPSPAPGECACAAATASASAAAAAALWGVARRIVTRFFTENSPVPPFLRTLLFLIVFAYLFLRINNMLDAIAAWLKICIPMGGEGSGEGVLCWENYERTRRACNRPAEGLATCNLQLIIVIRGQ